MKPGHVGVSVVIPTVGRQQLTRAIVSVLNQDFWGPIELIVVGDLPESSLDASLTDGADKILYTGGGKRGGAARNLGISAATHEHVAFLDDDDEWLPWKLSNQIRFLQRQNADVVGTQSVYRNGETGTTSSPVPSTVKNDEESVVEYLFRRRSAKVGRPVMYTSTLIAKTEFAKRVRWDESLKRHQDWDWVERLEREGARIMQMPDPSAVIWTGSNGSISSSADWESSLAWAETRRVEWKPEVLSDFLAGQTLRYALQSHSLRGIHRTISAVSRTRRLPSAQTLVLGLGGLIPRTLINRLLSK